MAKVQYVVHEILRIGNLVVSIFTQTGKLGEKQKSRFYLITSFSFNITKQKLGLIIKF